MTTRMMHSSAIVTRITKADAPGEIYRLEDMEVEEVSLVDRAANKRRFLTIKRSGKMPGATEVTSNGRGGLTTKSKTRKSAVTKVDVPPGFKEMVTPLLEKSAELLDGLKESIGSSTVAEIDEEGGVPGIPAEIAAGFAQISNLLERASSLFPAAPEEPEVGTEGDAPTEAPTEMQMRATFDNLAKVLSHSKLTKATVLKVGAKMSKDRFARLQQAAQVLSNLIAELGPSADAATSAPAAEPGAGAGASKSKKNEAPAGPELLTLEQGNALLGQLQKMTAVMQKQSQELAQLKKSRNAPSALAAEHIEKSADNEDQDFSWPLNMNRPMNRGSVDKSDSFFDD